MKRAHQLLERREDHPPGITDFRQLVLEDPAVMALHMRLLQEAPPLVGTPRMRLSELAEAARRRDTDSFSRQDWVALLSDTGSLRTASDIASGA